MSKTSWTPGPWSIGSSEIFPVIVSDHPDYAGQSVADTCASQLIYPRGAVSGNFPSDPEDHSKCNARLIAAAPEMAELLEAFGSKTILPDGSVIGLDRHDFERCRAILARIKGETP